ncbi:MAG: hypothetical protein GX617_08055 [Lentisphaerae bacterium]|nr:hypothetical protein [Lentisphaerota bacterium]
MELFATARERLEKQYECAVYDPASGLDRAGLQELFAAHRAAHPAEERVLTKAFLLKLIFTHGRIVPEPDNFFAGKVDHCGLLVDLRKEWHADEWSRQDKSGGMAGYWAADAQNNGVRYMIDVSHVAPDWPSVLRLGFTGLLERARTGDTPFHRACAMTYEGAIALCRRLGAASANSALAALAEGPPRTLHEAYQMAYIFHDLAENEGEEVRSMGRFDQLFIDYYRRDLAEGRLTRDDAKELTKYFWIAFYAKYQGKRFGKNFCFGPDINELSYLGMEVYYEMNTVDPKLSLRVTPDTPADFLALVARTVRDGRTGIVMLNDDMIIRGLIRHGRLPEDAREYLPIGCYEPAVQGKEVAISGATGLYLPRFVLKAMEDGRDYPDFTSFKAAYYDYLRAGTLHMCEMQRRCEVAWPKVHPTPFLAGSFPNCLRTGRDYSEGGVEYNSTGCVISYCAQAVDSLAAVDFLVYREKLCTLAELRQALAANWSGFEKLRLAAMNRAPKWGNNDTRADELAVELARFIGPFLNSQPNARGGHFFASLYGQLVVESGKRFGALPDGRLAGEPLSKNMDACTGMDRRGVTALMNSVLKIDMTDFPCGTCLDIMLHPSAVTGDDGLATLVAIIRAFIAGGGSGLQFNIFDVATLRDAQLHPDKYANLQVRVCGWNARFTDLTPEAQQTFIDQAAAMA